MAVRNERAHLPRVTWEQALAWRLARHRLVGRASRGNLLDVVRVLCGLHAQLFSSAELSHWARVDDLERADLARSLREERALVKLWAMRGTLHLLPADELGLWLAALATHTGYSNTGHPEFDALAAAVGQVFDGQVRSREELALAVEAITGDAHHGEWVRFSWGS